MRRRSAVVALAVYLAVLASVTLGASPAVLFVRGAHAVGAVQGLAWVTEVDVERAANVALFAPAGLLLCAALPGVSRLVVWLLCVGASASVEAAQYLLPDRDSSPIDVLTNGTGAAIGVLLHALLAWFSRRRRSRVPT